jgi:hypothetical protein
LYFEEVEMRLLTKALAVALVAGVSLPLTAQTPSSKPVPAPKTYGTSAPTYVSVAGLEFVPLNNGCNYDSDGESRWTDNCSGLFFSAPLHLPQGAKLLTLELDAWDTDTVGYVVGDLQVCDSSACHLIVLEKLGTVGPADCPDFASLCSGPSFAGGLTFAEADLSPFDITIDNFFNTYTLLAGRAGLATDAHGVRFRRMQLTYVLQVSPAPAKADFGDVPTTHQFFKFIEALYYSGITAGCGGGNYCPDRPLTRGEMAVYLATALGLQWN